MSNTYFLTTPIYYVNDVPHIGHAYTTLACDVIARFLRLDGKEVKFLTGTDEHGQKVEAAAEKAGLSPQAFVDNVSMNFRALDKAMNFAYDDFIRTTETRHREAVEYFWDQLVSKEQIYLGAYSGWYSIRDESFYHEHELVNGLAPTGAPVNWVEEPSYFFRLSQFQEPLLKFYEENPDFIAPTSRRNEVISFVKGGLRDLSISRTGVKWGIPVPGNSDHTIYVWIDALVNYLTGAGYPHTKSASFQNHWPAYLHVVGKDILKFHAVYWPALLMAAGLPLPKRIFAHGWWTNEGEKISKSLGNTIDPFELVKTYGCDATRYFLMREISFGSDGDFSRTLLKQRINSQLANELGNLVQRVLAMIVKNCDQAIPTPGPYTLEDTRYLELEGALLPELRHLIVDQQAIQKALELIWKLISNANKYIDDQAPWVLRKTNPERMNTVLYILADSIRRIGILIQPFMPETGYKILSTLEVSPFHRTFTYYTTSLEPGTKIHEPTALFPRLED
jgi:methionyl-tRNA synthetase